MRAGKLAAVRYGVAAFVTMLFAGAAGAQIDQPPLVPSDIESSAALGLSSERSALVARLNLLVAHLEAHNRQCSHVRSDDAAANQSCRASAASVSADLSAYQAALTSYTDHLRAAPVVATIAAPSPSMDPDDFRILAAMQSYVRDLPWPAEKKAHLISALDQLGVDGDPDATVTTIRQVWRKILERDSSVLAAAASRLGGPGFSSAGQQTRYTDCAIFALANASGRPYGLIAADAAELIGQAQWRSAAHRADPQGAIENDGGLMGGEVIILAEGLGSAEVVSSQAFPSVLRRGQPILVNVIPDSGDVDQGHEVLLTRTFEYNGQTWFEMIDSNRGPQRRLYLTAAELNVVLRENGVAFHPDPNRTPKLLREP